MVAVAIGCPIVMVAVVVPAPVVVMVAVVMIVMVAMAHGRVGLVVVVPAVEAAASMAMATPEGHEHCGTVQAHPSGTVAAVDGEGNTGVGPDDGTVEPLAGHEGVVLPGAEHIAQVAVAYFPPETEHVGAGASIEQVVDVDLLHYLIL